jgi:2-iminobutanoate/2-iminopropanoate deaminase
MKRVIHSEEAPRAVGPYSHAVQAAGLVFTAGQVGIDPASGKMVKGGIEAQTRQVMANLGAVLKAAGTGFPNVVKATVYLKDMNDFALFNEIYGSFFPSEPPARSTFQVSALPLGALVEVDLVALA